MSKLLSTTIFFLFNLVCLSQLFTEIEYGLKDIQGSSVAFGDFDNDDDLDILISGGYIDEGSNSYIKITRIYVNLGDTAINIEANLTGAMYGDVAWGDYDNDGYLDIVITGKSDNTKITEIYRNNGGTFNLVNDQITGVDNSSVDWGDYDNDGDLDLLITGKDQYNSAVGKIYQNEGNSIFVDSKVNIARIFSGNATFGDYDKDNDLDILMSGKDNSGNKFSDVYRNETNNVFSKLDSDIQRLINSNARWIDFWNNGNLDIFLFGDNYNSIISEYYSNAKTEDGEYLHQFNADGNYGLPGFIFGSVAFGDCNNDGLIDAVISGADNYKDEFYSTDEFFGGIYLRNGSYTYTDIFSLSGGDYNDVAFGDFDKDSVLDIIYSGGYWYEMEQNEFTNILINNITFKNSPPSIPTSLATYRIGEKIFFFWHGSLDNESPNTYNGISHDLTYNIFIGTTLNGCEILNPMSNLHNGYRKIPKLGNVGYDTAWYIKNLVEGKYYWGVQAIDNGFLGSVFAVDSFIVESPFVSILPGDTMVEPGAYQDPFNNISYSQFGQKNFGITEGDISWADYNGDNSLDILLSGANFFNGWNNETKICENDYKQFETDRYYYFKKADTTFIGVRNGASDWDDFDNDGDLDLLITGNSGPPDYEVIPVSKIYRNNGDTSFVDSNSFVQINAGLTGIHYSSVKWGDFDNDGDADIIICGKATTSDSIATAIYENNKGSFIKIQTTILDLAFGEVDIADYDKDMDLDILITGTYTGDYTGATTKIYKNLGDFEFIDINGSFENLYSSAAKWGDFDNDTDLDFIISGKNNLDDRKTLIYRNDGNDQFTELDFNFSGVENAEINWNDYDNDGDLDFLLSGVSSVPICVIYENVDYTNFEEINYGLAGIYDFTLFSSWADYDKDGDADIIATAAIICDPSPCYFDSVKLYKNNLNFENNIPKPPINLTSEKNGYGVILGWQPDEQFDETPLNGLTYNLRIGTKPDSCNILSPLSDLVTGFRRVPKMGNVQTNTSWFIDSLPVDTFYWSVQTIDQGYKGSKWAGQIDNGAEVSNYFIITALTANYSFDTICYGQTTSFIENSYNSGDPINSWYWDFGDGNSSTVQNPTHAFSTAGNHSVKLVVSNGAYTDSITKIVVVKEVPVCFFEADTACIGSVTNITNTTNENGLTISSWQWDFDDGNTSIIQNPGTHGYLNAGSYNVELIAIADNNCSDTIVKEVLVGAIPNSTISISGNTSFCDGDSSILSVPYNMNYNYLWKLNSVNLTGATNDSLIINTNSGNYTVEVTNPVGNCVSTSSAVPITVNPNPDVPAITTDDPTTFCVGDSAVLSNALIGGTWYKDGVIFNNSVDELSVKLSGTYKYLYTNIYSCSSFSDNLEINVLELPGMPTISQNGPLTFCQGDSVVLSVSNNPDYTYQWRNEYGNIAGATSNELIIKASDDYYLQITNTNSCSVFSEIYSVTVNPNPAVPDITTDDPTTFCAGDSAVLTNALIGGTWYKDGVIFNNSVDELSVKLSGTYKYLYTDIYSCSSSSDNLEINVLELPSMPTISQNGPLTFCQGDSVVLSVSNNPEYIYQWRNEYGNIAGATSNELIIEASGDYYLQITNTNSCSVFSEIYSVTVNPNPAVPDITTDDEITFCLGDSAVLINDLVGATWLKNGANIATNSGAFIAKSEGTYQVKYTNANNCTGYSNTIELTV